MIFCWTRSQWAGGPSRSARSGRCPLWASASRAGPCWGWFRPLPSSRRPCWTRWVVMLAGQGLARARVAWRCFLPPSRFLPLPCCPRQSTRPSLWRGRRAVPWLRRPCPSLRPVPSQRWGRGAPSRPCSVPHQVRMPCLDPRLSQGPLSGLRRPALLCCRRAQALLGLECPWWWLVQPRHRRLPRMQGLQQVQTLRCSPLAQVATRPS